MAQPKNGLGEWTIHRLRIVRILKIIGALLNCSLLLIQCWFAVLAVRIISETILVTKYVCFLYK